jgi:GH24 family phage-related lysozyme (muramidase)
VSNPAPITLEQLFRFYRVGLPHQMAAITMLEEDIRKNGYDVAMRRNRPWFLVWSQAGKQDDATAPVSALPQQQGPAWLPLAADIVKEFEGLELTAYPDPGTGGDPWTIGWGHTGPGVAKGLRISEEKAQAWLAGDLETAADALFRLLPMASKWKPHQQAALISFVFNVGAGALEESTLQKRLLAGEDPAAVIRAELPRWNKGGGGVLAGLTRRRAAEVALFLSGAAEQRPLEDQRSWLQLTKTGRRNSNGLELLNLAYVVGGKAVRTLQVVSGAPGHQAFRKGVDSRSGSMEPLPEGRWGVSDIAWAGGRDNYSANWGPGLGPASVPLRFLGPGSTERSAIEMHFDANHGTSPGTAGCVGFQSIADLQVFIGWLRKTDPRDLFVDWGLGTCPKPA